jgi:hypothetical protein
LEQIIPVLHTAIAILLIANLLVGDGRAPGHCKKCKQPIVPDQDLCADCSEAD